MTDFQCPKCGGRKFHVNKRKRTITCAYCNWSAGVIFQDDERFEIVTQTKLASKAL